LAKRKAKRRDYKAEYARRIKRALDQGYSRSVARGHAKHKKGELGIKAARVLNVKPGTNIFEIVARDAKYVFGRKPKRKDEPDAPTYLLTLEEKAKREGRFDWLNEAEFIESMKGLGFSERESYTMWFSP
jgi:hypothetical protein